MEGGKVGEAVREGDSVSHPFESGVVVAKRVDGGGLVEDVKVEVSEGWWWSLDLRKLRRWVGVKGGWVRWVVR